ncbi:hypothetical protein GCM10027447_34950 [Glycomyces halotolerans]
METDYRAAVEAHLRAAAATDADLRAAHEADRDETAALDRTVAEAGAERDRAARAADAAAELVAETDKATAELWSALTGFVGRRRAGPAPTGPAGSGDPDQAEVRSRLARADRLLRLARDGELPIEAPRHTVVTACLLGAVIGALAVASAAWLLGRGAAEGWRQAVAALVLFGGVGAGPLVLGAWLPWQYRIRPRPGHVVACAGGALAATCALAGVFLRGV